VLTEYFPVLVAVFIGIAVGIMPVIAGKILAPSKGYAAKNSPYECGFPAFADSRSAFDVRFYRIAILFILFDIELIFIFPWATILRELPALGWQIMSFFLGLLLIGFLYEWKKGALEWE
jgi:NADH-quinone oxidoreductase subunit A